MLKEMAMNEENIREDMRYQNRFEQRLQSIAAGLTLVFLVAIGGTLLSLVKSSAQQEIVNHQTVSDVAELKADIKSMREQTSATAAALANVTSATAASLAASTAALAAAAERDHKSGVQTRLHKNE